MLRHVPLVAARVQRRVFPHLRRRYGEDLIATSVPLLCAKVTTYDLSYRDKHGNSRPVPFAAYIWKRIDGFIIDSIKRETARDREEVSGLEVG